VTSTVAPGAQPAVATAALIQPSRRPRPAAPAARFHEILQRAAAEPAVALPQHFRPLATAIAGTHPVTVRRGPATTAALEAAGKPAATVGRVIHLRRPLDRSPQSVEILAHELVHAAHASPRVRFFGDERHSTEEHHAMRTGRLARALVAPPATGDGGAAPATLVRALDAPQVASPPAQRSRDRLAWGTQGLAVSSLGGTVKALAGEIAAKIPATGGAKAPTVHRRTSSGGRSSLVERTADLFRQTAGPSATGPAGAGASSAAAGTGTPANGMSPVSNLEPSFPRPGDPPIVRRSTWSGVQRFNEGQAPAAPTKGGIDPVLFEALVEALEQRVIDELERRGMRHHPGVF
jgi:hypothetical protein